MNDPRALRLADADRNACLDALTTAFVEGRLTREEFDDRSSAIMRAVVLADLDAPFEGLPGGVPIALGSSGQLMPRTGSAPALVDFDEEKELRALSRKGRVMDRVDSVAWTVAAVFFFANLFVLNIPHGWLAWLAAGAVSLIGRAIVGFDDSDEEAWEQIKESAEKERAERLKIALERRRELEK